MPRSSSPSFERRLASGAALAFLLALSAALASCAGLPSPAASGGGAASPAWQTIDFAPSSEVLRNPGCGLCFMPPLDREASSLPAWILGDASIAYFRLDWAEVVNDEGEYDFEGLDGRIFAQYRERGLRIAFRIMGANRHSTRSEVFPESILKTGAPRVVHRSFYGKEQLEPVFWDPRYVAEHGRMVAALGAYVRR
jgi:hypothetical protein